ncbi:DUF5958 family protein [Streptomyces sp. NPDC016459]|uniref:DUF5958 family protein n=1 Tax=Streptomyces sp. NPDC016459 TaxID=3157190 RepID=UPI0033BFF5EF
MPPAPRPCPGRQHPRRRPGRRPPRALLPAQPAAPARRPRPPGYAASSAPPGPSACPRRPSAPRRTRAQTLRFLVHHCTQPRAVPEDGPESIRRAGLRPTHTPAVLISRGRIDEQLGKIAGLAPLDERRKAFRLLIAVLAIADARRRERFCSHGCSHWWHRLSAA